jgi:hypothetical protein
MERVGCSSNVSVVVPLDAVPALVEGDGGEVDHVEGVHDRHRVREQIRGARLYLLPATQRAGMSSTWAPRATPRSCQRQGRSLTFPVGERDARFSIADAIHRHLYPTRYDDQIMRFEAFVATT